MGISSGSGQRPGVVCDSPRATPSPLLPTSRHVRRLMRTAHRYVACTQGETTPDLETTLTWTSIANKSGRLDTMETGNGSSCGSSVSTIYTFHYQVGTIIMLL